MTDHVIESGLELVLDNRKLILAFVLLIFVCGCFFVIGFIEGKRQGLQQVSQPVAEAAANAVTTEPQPATAVPSTIPEASKTIKPEEQPLDWYKSVNRQEGEPEKTLQPLVRKSESEKPQSAPAPSPESAPAEKPKSEVNLAHSGPVTYSVQVGAFRQKYELDVRAKMLKEKGFEYRIEPPNSPDDLYLLKVGTFHSRADAVAMQLRLKKSGFPCFIKTN
jgi:cell division protein FtsN